MFMEARVTIDIDKLSEPELVDLNHRIVERLRFLQQMRAHRQMLEFKIGDRVAFEVDGRGTVEGMLTRYNRKSVTVITDDGRQWNVSPGLLSRIAASPTKPQTHPNVIRLK
jgi:ribosomal protein L21E